jgi:DNA-binding response OmpR family regulator
MLKRISKGRVLLVDDEPDVCMVYQIVLQTAGYDCRYYTDSVKALNEFVPSYYDLILLDVKMPVLDGFELHKKIRDLDKNIQIIFTTAGGEYHDEIIKQLSMEENNKFTYIQKPIGNDELIRMLNMIMGEPTRYGRYADSNVKSV